MSLVVIVLGRRGGRIAAVHQGQLSQAAHFVATDASPVPESVRTHLERMRDGRMPRVAWVLLPSLMAVRANVRRAGADASDEARGDTSLFLQAQDPVIVRGRVGPEGDDVVMVERRVASACCAMAEGLGYRVAGLVSIAHVDAPQPFMLEDGAEWVVVEGPGRCRRTRQEPAGELATARIDVGHPASWIDMAGAAAALERDACVVHRIDVFPPARRGFRLSLLSALLGVVVALTIPVAAPAWRIARAEEWLAANGQRRDAVRRAAIEGDQLERAVGEWAAMRTRVPVTVRLAALAHGLPPDTHALSVELDASMLRVVVRARSVARLVEAIASAVPCADARVVGAITQEHGDSTTTAPQRATIECALLPRASTVMPNAD